MRKLLLFLLVSCFCFNVYSADQWTKGAPASSDTAADIGTLMGVNNNATDRLNIDHRQGCRVNYLSAATVTVTSGTLALSNSDGSVVKWRRNTSDTTVTWANVVSGTSESASTTFYLWGLADTDATTFTIGISTSSSAPAGSTYYRLLGSFYNDASSDINYVNQYPAEIGFGAWATKTNNTVYQAATDGFVTARGTSVVVGYTDASNPPTTQRAGDVVYTLIMPVRKGDFWKVTGADTSLYWISLGE